MYSDAYPVMAYCQNQSQTASNTSKTVPQNTVSRVVHVVAHSYLHQFLVSFSVQATHCHGVFLDPCTLRLTLDEGRPAPVQFKFIVKKQIQSDNLINLRILDYCDYVIQSHTSFMSFTLEKDSCVVVHITTPPWQYDPKRDLIQFQYHCKLILLQDHTSEPQDSALHYDIKLFQHEASVVLLDNSPGVMSKEKQCLSLVDEFALRREMTGFGDMMSFLFKRTTLKSQKHKIFGNLCPNVTNYVTDFTSSWCDTKIYSKSYNSSLVSFYDVTEPLRKLRIEKGEKPWNVEDTGTFALRLMGWGSSWISIKMQRSCKVINRHGFQESICDFSQISSCTAIPSEKLGSIIRLTPRTGVEHNVSEHDNLGVVKIHFTLTGICAGKSYPAYIATVTLKKLSFKSMFYDLFLPVDYKSFHVTLSQNDSFNHIDVSYHSNFYFPFYQSEHFWQEGNKFCDIQDTGFTLIQGSSWTPTKVLKLGGSLHDSDWLCISSQYRNLDLRAAPHCEYSTTKHSTLISIRFKGFEPFSWREAQRRCVHVDGSLLKVYSTSDIREVVKLFLKFVHDEKYPFFAFYYGIQRQVSILWPIIGQCSVCLLKVGNFCVKVKEKKIVDGSPSRKK